MAAAWDVVLDGSEGEGGGQILLSSLTISIFTGKSFHLRKIRAGRQRPGLAAQHLASVQAAAAICDAEVDHAELGARELGFRPKAGPRAGSYEFEIGTAGSTSLLLQTIALPLCVAGDSSEVRIRGGTHGPHAPTFHDLALGWAPLLRSLGWPVEVHLVGAGFHPAGGGEIVARIGTASHARPVDLRRHGNLTEVQVLPILADLPNEIAQRMGEAANDHLREAGVAAQVEATALPAGPSPGAALCIQATYEKLPLTFCTLGRKGLPAEEVAGQAVEAFLDHIISGMAVEHHLADQLLLPLALASAGLQGGPTPIQRFTTTRVTQHLRTNAAVLRRFLDLEVSVFRRLAEAGEVRLMPAGIGEVLPMIHAERESVE